MGRPAEAWAPAQHTDQKDDGSHTGTGQRRQGESLQFPLFFEGLGIGWVSLWNTQHTPQNGLLVFLQRPELCVILLCML